MNVSSILSNDFLNLSVAGSLASTGYALVQASRAQEEWDPVPAVICASVCYAALAFSISEGRESLPAVVNKWSAMTTLVSGGVAAGCVLTRRIERREQLPGGGVRIRDEALVSTPLLLLTLLSALVCIGSSDRVWGQLQQTL